MRSQFLYVTNELKAVGLTLTYSLAMKEYRVNFTDGGESTACYCDTLHEAQYTGLEMSKEGKK